MKWIGVILLLAAGVLAVKLIDWDFMSHSQITEYPILCKDTVVENQCAHPDHTEAVTTYTVNVDGQFVVYSSDSAFNKGVVRRLSKCAVQDRRNWTCKYDDESGEFGFTSGLF
jgi:hypothetical protein